MTITRTLRTAGSMLALGAAMLAGCAAAPAADAPPEPPPTPEAEQEVSPELRAVLDRLDEAGAELEDITARVTYEREIPLLDEKDRSRGSLTFKKPDRIALKLARPRNEEVYTNGELWWVVSHDEEQVEVYEAAEEGEAGREAAFLQFGYGTGSEELLKNYRIELVEERAEDDEEPRTVYRVKFTPRQRPDRPPRYAAIEVEVSDALWLPHFIVLHESGGEIVHSYALSKARINTGVEDELFEYEPPDGYTVVRPERL
jgi:outer membrane lipoprotein-sorting protein